MPLVLTRRGWALLLWAVVLWSCWWIVGLRDMWYLSAFLGALVVVSGVAVLVLPTAAGLKLNLIVTDPTPRAGETTAISIRMRQRLALTFRCVADIDTTEEASRQRLDLTGGQAVFKLAWWVPRRGWCPVSVRRLTVQDPLGLVSRRLGSARQSQQLLVLPARYEDSPELLEAAGGLGSLKNQWNAHGGPANADSPGGAVRDYRTGDALRRIHWKQSARQGKLLTNIPETYRPEEEISVLLITSAMEYSDVDEFERAVSITATLVERWAQQGHRVRLLAGGQAPLVSASAAELLAHLAVVTTDPRARPDELFPARDRVAMVVTGILTQAVAEQVGHSGPAGAVIAAGQQDHVSIPRGWRLLLVGQDSDTSVSDRLREATT